MSNTFSRYPVAGGGSVIPTYANFAALPGSATDGALALTLDSDTLYAYNLATSTWLPIAAPGMVLSVGTFDSGVASADGAHIDSTALIMQSASASNPGLMNTSTQTIGGNKTFNGAITASNLSGTNTGNVTLTAVGAVPNANGASLSGQALTLQPANASFPGVLTAADWNTFKNKQAALTIGDITDAGTDGIVITGGTAAVIGAGVSIAQHVADASHNGYLSSTDWSTFNNKGTVTAVSVASANGFAGSSSGGATPALTLSTTITGILQGNGTAISAASTTGSGAIMLAASPATTGTLSAAAISASGAITGSNLSGTNTGDQTITLTGDVTGTGNGSFAATIGNNKVTNAKLDQMPTLTIKGNNTGGTANTIDLTVAQVNTMLGTVVNPMTTGGDIIYGGASGTPTRLANGSAGQHLVSGGGTAAPVWTSVAPTVQKITSTGSTTGYRFAITTSSTVAVGDTYTNNGNTYTVLVALSAQSGSVFYASGASAPTGSGNLVQATGSGTTPIAFTSSTAMASYTRPTGPTPAYLKVTAVAGGGGGGGGGNASGNAGAGGGGGGATVVTYISNPLGTYYYRVGAGGAGGTGGGVPTGGSVGQATFFANVVAISATGGSGGAQSGVSANSSGGGGAGGGGTGGTVGIFPGNAGSSGGVGVASTASGNGGVGGGSMFGGGGQAGASNTATAGSNGNTYGGGGGGATQGVAGGDGGAGVIIVEEFY